MQQKTKEREAIQKEMARLEVERSKYIEQETLKNNQQKTDDFGTAVAASMKAKAKALGFE